MPRPATVFSFATNTLNNGTFSTPNKKPLSPTKLQDGFLVETLHRGELNTLFHDIGEWITHFADDLNGQKIEFGTTKTEIPVIDGDIISTRANVVKQVIGNSSTKVTNNLEVVANNSTTTFSVNKETGVITAPSFTGNAGSASNWQTARKLTLSGGVTGNVNLDGSGDATLSTTLANFSGAKITSGTVAAARVGALPASKITSGSFNVARIPSLNASKINAGVLDVARLPSATTDNKGVIEKATTAEMTAGTTDTYPDSATVKEFVDNSLGEIRVQGNSLATSRRLSGVLDVSSEGTATSFGFMASDNRAYAIVDNKFFQYNITGPEDISAAVLGGSYDPAAQSTSINAFYVSKDGTRLIAFSSIGDFAYQYDFGTPFELSTLSYSGNSYNTGPITTNSNSMTMNEAGTRMYVTSSIDDAIYQINLGTSFNLSTASNPSKSLDTSAQATGPIGFGISPDGKAGFVYNSVDGFIYEYVVGTDFELDILTVYKNISYKMFAFGVYTGFSFSPEGKYFLTSNNSTDVLEVSRCYSLI